MTALISPGQTLALRNLIKRIAGESISRDQRLWIVCQIIQREVSKTDELTRQEWIKIRNTAYPHWPEDDWETINPSFHTLVANLSAQYLEKVLGQQRLL